MLTTTLPAWAAETYEVTATTTLEPAGRHSLHQRWTADCVAGDVVEGAAIAPGGKDLRFFAAPDEVLAVSVDDARFAIADGSAVDGGYDYDDVVGAHVFARFSVACGSDAVFDEAVVDSTDVVTAPGLDAPFTVRRVDDFAVVRADEVPAGVVVELVDLAVRARPRGAERVVVTIVDALGTALGSIELGSDDVGVDGRAVVSPQVVTSALGDLTVIASFLGESSDPLVFTVVDDPGAAEGEGEDDLIAPGGGGCAGGGAAAGEGAVVVFAGLLLRRRRR
jgi:hypothetical protein